MPTPSRIQTRRSIEQHGHIAQCASLDAIMAKSDHANAQRYGHFPELTIEQNRVIWEAREKGWDEFFPVDSRLIESFKTFNGASEYLKSL